MAHYAACNLHEPYSRKVGSNSPNALRHIMKILLVEDDEVLGEAVMLAIRQSGFDVDWARDGIHASHACVDYAYDAILLDLGLPRREGLEVLRSLRRHGTRVPVMILTARDSVEDRVRGLDAGADDYLLKPFALDELLARLRALIRRASGKAATETQIGRLRFDSLQRQAWVDETPLVLSAREVSVLEILLNHTGRVIAKEAIIDRLSGWDEGLGDNAVEVYIHRLRRKLNDSGVAIRTLRGLGYMVEAGRD